jgi:hypothetical protein
VIQAKLGLILIISFHLGDKLIELNRREQKVAVQRLGFPQSPISCQFEIMVLDFFFIKQKFNGIHLIDCTGRGQNV